MTLRLATETDLPAVVSLIRAVVPLMHAAGNFQWESAYPNEEVLRRDVLNQWLWVAELGGRVAGVAALTTANEPEYAQVGWDLSEPVVVVHRLAVHPEAQGRGVAAALLHQAETVGREHQKRAVRVDTNSENAATQRLFPKLGYQFAGEITLGFRPGLRFFCYEKRLD